MSQTNSKRWSFFAVGLPLLAALAAAFSAGASAEADTRANLTGMVIGSNGAPVPGATVFIDTAGPRTGTSVVCPGCYPDCQRHATTGTDGRFTIEPVSPSLLFRILVAARHYRPQFRGKIDPLLGPVTIRLERLDPGKIGPKQALRGRVIGPSGKPIFGATVTFDFFYGDQANCGGACEGVDPVAVTDPSGSFILTATKRFDSGAEKSLLS